MEIFRIEEYKKSRRLVYLEEEAPAFCLYTKEIRQFDLKEGEELSDETYEEILEILKKRARERALYLLDDMPRSANQIRKKLKEGYYPEEAIEFAVSYCEGKHYVDDLAYAMRYIEEKRDTLSKRMIERKLYERGIDKETMEKAFSECEISETDTVKALIERKYSDIGDMDHEERQKIIRKLLAKGFSYDSIRSAVNSRVNSRGICDSLT